MTAAERGAALEAYGFTPRQAAFVTTVLLHGGVCVPRQYCAFAGITRGKVVQEFFASLTTRRLATVYPFGRKGSHAYHLHHKALYRAIGEPDSRYRRRASVERALERLMVIDAVLMKRELTWLATEREKVTYCRQDRKLSEEELPRLIFEGGGSRTVRFFPEKLPLGVSDGSDELALLYLVTEPTGTGVPHVLGRARRAAEAAVEMAPRPRLTAGLHHGRGRASGGHSRLMRRPTPAGGLG